jgi:hypothetical protein
MDGDKFRLEARRLIRKGIADRSERMSAVSTLIDIYVGENGNAPDADITDKLTDYVLHEELADAGPHKSRHTEYSILSDRQLSRRRSGKHQRKSASKGEVSLKYVSGVASDNVDVLFYDTPEVRLKYEINREAAYYTELNREQPVTTRTMTAEEYESIKPHPHSAYRGKEHVEWSLDVRRRDGFTCQKCGKRGFSGMHAHHIEAYNTAIELRSDLNNGIALCRGCHSDFHAMYGKGGNNRVQLDEWMGESYYEL